MMNAKSKRLIRKPEVLDVTAIGSNSNLYYLINKQNFPAPVRLADRMVAWRESEVLDWIDSRERSIIQGGKS